METYNMKVYGPWTAPICLTEKAYVHACSEVRPARRFPRHECCRFGMEACVAGALRVVAAKSGPVQRWKHVEQRLPRPHAPGMVAAGGVGLPGT